MALAPSDAGAASCASKGSRTFAQNDQARLFRDADLNWLVCSRTTGNAVVLASDPEEWLTRWKLGGSFIAYYWNACEPPGDGPCYGDLRVLDVRRGRYAHSIGDNEPFAIVVHPNGALAWTEEGYGGEDTGGYVYRSTFRGKTRLDRGPDVDPGSLRLRGRKVSWVNGGRVRRATLR